MSHEVDTKSFKPEMKAYLSKAAVWNRMKLSNAKVEQQRLSTTPGENEHVWVEAINDDGSKDRWGFKYRTGADGIVFKQDDLYAYFHYPDADSSDAVHNGIVAFYDQNSRFATTVRSDNLEQYQSKATDDYLTNMLEISNLAKKHNQQREAVQDAQELAKHKYQLDYVDRSDEAVAKKQEAINKTIAVEERKSRAVAASNKYNLSVDVDRSDEATDAYATTFQIESQLESQTEEKLNYMREQLSDDSELLDAAGDDMSSELDRIHAKQFEEQFESKLARLEELENRLEELENLVQDEDPDMLQEKENIKAREVIRKKIEATERERKREDKLEETKNAARSKYNFKPGSGEESDTEESASEQAETPEQDLSADAAVAADETAAAEAAITTPDATDIAQYAASVSKEPMINHIFKNSFYNDRPTTRWAYAMDFIPTNEFLSSHTASEIVEMCKLLTRATIKTEIPARSSTSVTSRYKGISIELPARTTTSGDLRITFAENKYSDIARTLHFLMQSSHNRNYPIDLSSMSMTIPADSNKDSDEDLDFSMPFRWSNGYHAHQFNIAIYLYKAHEAHIFNPFAEGKTPEYVYLFHQCDLYGVDKVDFNYDNDGMIDMVGTFMYQHFEEMRFLEYCRKRYITYDEWQDKEIEKQKALLAEIEAKKAEEAAAKAPAIRQRDGVQHTNEYLKAKDEAAAAYVDSQALSRRASMAAQQAGMSSYGRRR